MLVLNRGASGVLLKHLAEVTLIHESHLLRDPVNFISRILEKLFGDFNSKAICILDNRLSRLLLEKIRQVSGVDKDTFVRASEEKSYPRNECECIPSFFERALRKGFHYSTDSPHSGELQGFRVCRPYERTPA